MLKSNFQNQIIPFIYLWLCIFFLITFNYIASANQNKTKPLTIPVTAQGLKPGEVGQLKTDPKQSYPLRTKSLDATASKDLAQKVDSAKFDNKFLGSNSRSANLSPEEQKKQFILQEGFEIELVASEQLGFKKIVDIAFDSSGRMWAVTASEYPADSMGSNVPFHLMLKGAGVNRSERVKRLWSQGGMDQILLFENPTAPSGQVKNPILFSEGHAMPVGALPYKDGVIVIEGERLKFLQDSNGDGRADKVKLLADGFGAQDTHTGTHALKFMPGEWVSLSQGVLNWGNIKDAGGKVTPFNRSGTAYIRPNGNDFQIMQKGLQNIWGYYTSPEGEIWMHEANNVGYPMVPYYEYFTLPMTTPKKDFYRDYMTIYPPTGGINLDGSSLSGLERSDDLVNGFPKPWQDCYFIAHPGPNKVHSTFVQQKADQHYNITRGKDFIQSKDPNFRPIDLEFGPDGCLYIVDWYNRVIDHNGVSRDHPARNKDYSRIWRVKHKSQKHIQPKNLRLAKTQDLIKHLQSKSTWEMHHAWREIAERQDKSITPQLKSILANTNVLARHRVHALWSLESLKEFDWNLWKTLLKDKNKNIRIQALRSLGNLEPSLSITFDTLKAHYPKEKNFEVNKYLFNYFINSKNINSTHIAWLMQYTKEPLNLTGRPKAIWHEAPNRAEFVQQHFSDLARLTFENHSKETLAYLSDSKTPEAHKKYLKKYVLPYLNTDISFSNMQIADLKDAKTRQLAYSQSKKQIHALLLLKKYFQSIDVGDAVEQIISSEYKFNREQLDHLLAPLLKQIEPQLYKNEKLAIIYLKSMLLVDRLLDGQYKSWAPSKFITHHPNCLKLSKTFPSTNVYLSCLNIPLHFGKDSVYAEKSNLWFHQMNQHKPSKVLVDTYIREILLKWNNDQRATLLNIMAKEPFSLANTLNIIQTLPKEKQNIPSQVLPFIKERYEGFAGPNHKIGTLDNKGYFMMKKQYDATFNKENHNTKQQIERWKSIANNNKLKANHAQGKILFDSLCLSCHQVGKNGKGIAPSLDGLGNRHLEELITAIVHPDQAVESNYRSTRLNFHNGDSIEGLAQTKPGGVSLLFMGGAKSHYKNIDIAYKHTRKKSFMPTGLTAGLDDQTTKNLLAYILNLK